MLNAAAIATSLAGLVGIARSGVAASLSKSVSGLYVGDVSELLTLDVLAHAKPPGETQDAWLTRLVGDALARFVPQLTAAQSLDGQVLLAETRLVKHPGQRANTVNKLGRFVGIQLDLAPKRGVRYELPKVSLQLDGYLSDPLTLYLYADSQPDPVATFKVPGQGVNRPNFPYVLELADAELPTGARLWLGYYEDDLPLGVHAIYGDLGPCGCADDPYQQVLDYMAWRPAAAAVSADYLMPDRTLFDPARVGIESGTYGLNLYFTAYCDVATSLESSDNHSRLAPLVQQALALRLVRALRETPNITQLTGRPETAADLQYLQYSLEAQIYGGKVPGTEEVYTSGLKTLTLDLSGLDSKCGPPSTSLLSMGSLTVR